MHTNIIKQTVSTNQIFIIVLYIYKHTQATLIHIQINQELIKQDCIHKGDESDTRLADTWIEESIIYVYLCMYGFWIFLN